jgi:hypothetical protein
VLFAFAFSHTGSPHAVTFQYVFDRQTTFTVGAVIMVVIPRAFVCERGFHAV